MPAIFMPGVMRGIIAFITTAIFGGACLVFGFSPDTWIEAVITYPPSWLSHPLTRIGAIILGGLFGWWTWKLYQGWRSVSRIDQKYPLAALDEWRKTDPLLLWQAGCLWKVISPRYPVEFDNPAYPDFSMLLRAAEHGELELIKREPNPNLAISHVTRQALYDYAKKKNDVPEFLKDMEGINRRLTETRSNKHDAWLTDAAQYIASRSWMVMKITIDDGSEIEKLYDAAKSIHQAACDGDLPIWGMNNFSGPLILIEKEYWRIHRLEFMGVLKTEAPEDWKTEYMTHNKDQPIYHSLKTSKSEVEKLWPLANT